MMMAPPYSELTRGVRIVEGGNYRHVASLAEDNNERTVAAPSRPQQLRATTKDAQ